MTPRNNTTILNQEAAFSLMELLVTMGMMSIVIVGSLQVMQGHLKGQRTIRQVGDVNKLQLGLESFISNLEICSANFAGKNLNQLKNISTLVNTEGKTVYQVGDKFSNGSLELTSIQASNFKSISGPGGTVDFSFAFKKLDQESTVAIPIIRNIQLPVTLTNFNPNPAAGGNVGRILSCGAGQMNEKACVQMGGHYFPDATGDHARCTFRQIIVSPDNSVKSSKSALHIAPSGMYSDIGHIGMGYAENDFWANGGTDSVVHFSATNANAQSSIYFGWNHNPATAPFESSSSAFPDYNDGLQIVLTDGGRVGIGYKSYWSMRATPANFVPVVPNTKLYVRDDIRVTNNVYAQDVYANNSIQSAGGAPLTSDLRKKKNLESIHHAFDRILKLVGFSYEWRKEKLGSLSMPEGRDYGLIAQNVEKVFPELVVKGPDGYKWVHYQKLMPIFIEALRELTHKKQELKIEVDRLEADIAEENKKLQEISKLMRDSK